MNTNKIGILVIIFLVSSIFVVHASEIDEGRSIVEQRISCSSLSEDQLEAVGEYLMETMHPGEAHEVMHQRIGLIEGTREHNIFHINLARTMYCSEDNVMPMIGMKRMMNNNIMNYGYKDPGAVYTATNKSEEGQYLMVGFFVILMLLFIILLFLVKISSDAKAQGKRI